MKLNTYDLCTVLCILKRYELHILYNLNYEIIYMYKERYHNVICSCLQMVGTWMIFLLLQKEEIKLSLFTDDMIIYIENLKDLTKKLLEPMSNYNKL